MKATSVVLAFLLIAAVIYNYGCAPVFRAQPFDAAKWNEQRETHPDLNVTPWMLGDLMTNHLSLGMPMDAVTNLLGSAEITTPFRAGVWTRGEFIKETVYVYRPGMHNGWRVQGTNPLILWFGQKGKYVREWSPAYPAVQPVSAMESEAAGDARTYGGLHVGNLRYAGRPDQLDALLGPPDEKRTEWQLDYFLGKRARFAWDEIFLELHFDDSNRLSRMTWSEH
jgi:hypothetical protein